jgi:NagD protein
MRETKSYLLDMDGVLVRGRTPIPGAAQFIASLLAAQTPFLVITNNPVHTPQELHERFVAEGLDIPADHIHTSAQATAQFVAQQRPGGSAYVIGERGMFQALAEVGYRRTEEKPDYVVVAETVHFDFQEITKGIRLILAGARFIATNPDNAGPSDDGVIPECGALAALIESATRVKPYFIGKPNPLMMRSALQRLNALAENAVMVGDRMDTDIVAGMEAGMDTILVLSGVSSLSTIDRFPYRPTRVLGSVAEIDLGEHP